MSPRGPVGGDYARRPTPDAWTPDSVCFPVKHLRGIRVSILQPAVLCTRSHTVLGPHTAHNWDGALHVYCRFACDSSGLPAFIHSLSPPPGSLIARSPAFGVALPFPPATHTSRHTHTHTYILLKASTLVHRLFTFIHTLRPESRSQRGAGVLPAHHYLKRNCTIQIK